MKTLLQSLTVLVLLAAAVTVSAQTEARFYTTHGEFDVKLREDLVPITAGNFISLVDTQFYDGVIWHRVVQNFVIQSGDPTGTGSGGPGYTIQDEFHVQLRHYKKGILSMANSGPNTGGSQFFICLKPLLYLDSLHAVFGEVINNMQVIDAIAAVAVDQDDRPLVDVVNDSVRILAPVARVRELTEAPAVLGGNFPNPFNESTTFAFGLRTPSEAKLHILDAQGRLLNVLHAGFLPAGDHHLRWDGRDASGKLLPDGIYFYQLHAAGIVDARPMIIRR